MAIKHALIVDDSKTARVVLKRMLEELDLEVDTVEFADDAINYLKQASEIEDEDDLADSYYYLAMCYQNLKNYPLSRKYALKSLEVKPDNGNPYILIGDLYGSSGKECGDNDLTKKVAYWAAVDKYIKAKRVDPSVAEIAKSRIRSYSIHFPSLETIFFYDLQEGESYTVECWINEVTTVRAAK